MSREHVFGRYVYHPNKQVLIKRDLNRSDVGRILESYPDDPAARLPVDLSVFDPDDMIIGSGPVTQCGISLTDRCQLRCSYCSNSSEGSGRTLDIRQVSAFIDNMVEWRSRTDAKEPFRISFTGDGEPTLEWEIFEASVHHARDVTDDAGLETHLYLTTNGVMDDRKRDFIASEFDDILISYDGDPSLNAEHRPRSDGSDVSVIVEQTIESVSGRNPHTSIRSTF